MTAAPVSQQDRTAEARQLYENGLSLRQMGARLGVSQVTVGRLLRDAGVPMRKAARHLRVVPDVRARCSPALQVPPDRAAMVYTADRGWHTVQSPPAWALDLLAELE